jgi:hypothetical protein
MQKAPIIAVKCERPVKMQNNESEWWSAQSSSIGLLRADIIYRENTGKIALTSKYENRPFGK